MKRISSKLIAMILAVMMAVLLPMQVFADAQPEYIGEVKIGYGEDADTAKAALDGYTILSDDSGNPVDLNQNAGGGMGSKGERVVYFGYKTTKEASEAVTDMALMNMMGGYSVQDYEALMESQLKGQIIPFVERFQTAITEYRENYTSDIETNHQRAQYIHDALNTLKDDDCGGAGLGDLLLNETKYEMGDEAYDALSAEEKTQHADILTIIAQANGKATLLMENLLTRAADTNEESWLDRFVEMTYDDLLEETGLAPSKAAKEVARQYDDDAQTLLTMWDAFSEDLNGYDTYKEIVDNYDETALVEAYEAVEALGDDADPEALVEAMEVLAEEREKENAFLTAAEIVGVHEYLENIEYGDGTLLDFFTQSADDMQENITAIYPLIASFSDGQKAGLEFVSLKEMVMIAATPAEEYKELSNENATEASIYEGVNREIYQKGGVALTSDALRANASTLIEEDSSQIGTLSIVFIALTAASAVGFLASISFFARGKYQLAIFDELSRKAFIQRDAVESYKHMTNEYLDNYYKSGKARAAWGGKLSIGFGVAAVILAGITTYLTYRDMVNYYKVDFTPIPHFIIDEKDLVSYNSKGEKVVLKNQSAYYQAVETNRAEGDENFDILGTCNDINGTVGKQWLALYVVKNEAEDPIDASSLKAVVGDSNLPAGYETGIHTFGSEAAFNLNNSQYVWNSSAPAVYVYYKKAAGKAEKNTGANFTTGTLALAGGAGIAVGAAGMAAMMLARRKKENKAITE